MKYLAIHMNGEPDNNIIFEAHSLNSAQSELKHKIKKGSMFNVIKLVELETMNTIKLFFK